MDKLEEALDQMSKMPEKQRESLIEIEKKKICVCKTCPSYSECMGDSNDGLFCILGESNCEAAVEECVCAECPAHSNFNLENGFYCRNGSEMDIRSRC